MTRKSARGMLRRCYGAFNAIRWFIKCVLPAPAARWRSGPRPSREGLAPMPSPYLLHLCANTIGEPSERIPTSAEKARKGLICASTEIAGRPGVT